MSYNWDPVRNNSVHVCMYVCMYCSCVYTHVRTNTKCIHLYTHGTYRCMVHVRTLIDVYNSTTVHNILYIQHIHTHIHCMYCVKVDLHRICNVTQCNATRT